MASQISLSLPILGYEYSMCQKYDSIADIIELLIVILNNVIALHHNKNIFSMQIK